MSDRYVLDSYAILALLRREAGSEVVADLLRRGQGDADLLMTWVNVGEVAYIVERRWGKVRAYQALGTLEATGVEFVPAARELALGAASIKAAHPLAYGDAFAAALAVIRRATLVTGDPEFKCLEGDNLSVQWIC